jgi:hypothetical protein
MFPPQRLWPRANALVLFIGMAVCISSCGAKREFATVTGKVTYNGQPVTAGSVYFVADDDPEATGGGPLAADGSFKCLAPVGKVKMAIQTSAFKPKSKEKSNPAGSGPGPKGGPPPWAIKGPAKKDVSGVPSPEVIGKTAGGAEDAPQIGTKFTPIPEKYETTDQSGLSFDIPKTGIDLGEITLTGEVKGEMHKP